MLSHKALVALPTLCANVYGALRDGQPINSKVSRLLFFSLLQNRPLTFTHPSNYLPARHSLEIMHPYIPARNRLHRPVRASELSSYSELVPSTQRLPHVLHRPYNSTHQVVYFQKLGHEEGIPMSSVLSQHDGPREVLYGASDDVSVMFQYAQSIELDIVVCIGMFYWNILN